MTIFIGNLSTSTGEADLLALFRPFGSVKLAKLVYDGFTRRSRGFGYVEMLERGDGEAAIQGLNNKFLGGRSIVVNESQEGTTFGKKH